MRILLATDGSNYAKMAAKKVCEFIPDNGDIQIRIVSVTETVTPMEPAPFGVPGDYYSRITKDIKKASENFVADAKKIIEENFQGNLEIETDVLRGFPKETIVEEAKEWEADLIVVGSHGYGFWERMLLGSVSDAIIHHAPCSVLIVRGE